MAASGESTMQRTFSVIEYMSGQRRRVSLQEIAEALSLSGVAVQRLLKGLMDLGYAEQDENERYYLSYKIYKVAGKALNRDGLLRELIPYMNYFALRYGFEVGLTAFSGGSIVHILNVGRNINFGKAFLRPGQVFPAYCSAPGKIYLAQLEDGALKSWIANQILLPHTLRTIVDRERLYEEILRTRERGYSVSEGELYDVVYAVAFPVHDQDGCVLGTFNFRMLPEVYEKNMRNSFTEDVGKAMKNFGL